MLDIKLSSFRSYIKLIFGFSQKQSILLLFSGILYGFIFNGATISLASVIDNIGLTLPNLSKLSIPLAVYLFCMGSLFFITNFQSHLKKYKSASLC